MKRNKLNAVLLIDVAVVILAFIVFLLVVFITPVSGDARTYTKEDVETLTKCVWGEYRGYDTDQVAGVVWCVLNRVDDDHYPNDISSVVKQPWQFSGYSASNPVDPRIEAVVYDVLARWQMEPQCIGSVGRILPKEYLYFHGNGFVNLYKTECNSRNYWDWSLTSPYGTEK